MDDNEIRDMIAFPVPANVSTAKFLIVLAGVLVVTANIAIFIPTKIVTTSPTGSLLATTGTAPSAR